jgi:hypothetical protein
MICGPGVQRQRQQAGEGLDVSDGQARNVFCLAGRRTLRKATRKSLFYKALALGEGLAWFSRRRQLASAGASQPSRASP